MTKEISSLVTETINNNKSLEKELNKVIKKHSHKKKTKKLKLKLKKLNRKEKKEYGKIFKKTLKKTLKKPKIYKDKTGKKRIRSGNGDWDSVEALAAMVGLVLVVEIGTGLVSYLRDK